MVAATETRMVAAITTLVERQLRLLARWSRNDPKSGVSTGQAQGKLNPRWKTLRGTV
jgi:hypothetical protein